MFEHDTYYHSKACAKSLDFQVELDTYLQYKEDEALKFHSQEQHDNLLERLSESYKEHLMIKEHQAKYEPLFLKDPQFLVNMSKDELAQALQDDKAEDRPQEDDGEGKIFASISATLCSTSSTCAYLLYLIVFVLSFRRLATRCADPLF